MKTIYGNFRRWAVKFVQNKRAELTDKLVGIIIALTVAGAMLPSAIVSLSNSTAYTGADAGVITMATVVLPTLAVIGIALMVLRARKGA